MEGHCLQAMKIVHHNANGCVDWLISGHQSVNPSSEAISILSGKYKRFTFVHPVASTWKAMRRYSCIFLYIIPLLACARVFKAQGKTLFWKNARLFQPMKMAVHKDVGLIQHTTHCVDMVMVHLIC